MNQNPMQLAAATSRHSETSQERLALVLQWLTIYELVFPGFGETRGEPEALLYCELLADLCASDLAYGLEQAAKRCKAYPTPGHIREHAEARPGRTDPSAYSNASKAGPEWGYGRGGTSKPQKPSAGEGAGAVETEAGERRPLHENAGNGHVSGGAERGR